MKRIHPARLLAIIIAIPFCFQSCSRQKELDTYRMLEGKGIDLEDKTWAMIKEIAESLDVKVQ